MPLVDVEPKDYILRYHGDDIALNGTFVVLFETDPVDGDTKKPRYLSSLAYSVILPNVNVDSYNYQTKFKNQLIIPSSLTISQQFTLRFYDVADGLVNQYFQKWTLALRSHFPKILPNNLSQTPIAGKKVKTNIAIVMTDESFTQVYQTFIFAGCFPTSIPITAMNSDIVSRNIISFDISFYFDFLILGNAPQVDDYIKTISEDLQNLHQLILKDYK